MDIPCKGLPIISLVILNRSGKVPNTSFIFRATGLYFFAKQLMTSSFISSRLPVSSSTAIQYYQRVSGFLISYIICPRSIAFSSSKVGLLLSRYNNLNSSILNIFSSNGRTSLMKGLPSQSSLIIQGISFLGNVSDSSRLAKNLPGSLLSLAISLFYMLVLLPCSQYLDR